MQAPADLPDCRIARVLDLRLVVTAEPWPFVARHRDAIARHWSRRSSENPSFWDGEVLIMRGLDPRSQCLEATFSLERFSAFLYWRDHEGLDDGLDGFGTAIVRSAEGHVLVGRAAAGTLNEGLVYLPGGFLDIRDRAPDGTLDVAACAARELAEEIGLDVAGLTRVPGIIVARHGRHCCFAAEWRSTLPSDALLAHLRDAMARRGDQELRELTVVRTPEELERQDIIGHARYVIRNILAGTV